MAAKPKRESSTPNYYFTRLGLSYTSAISGPNRIDIESWADFCFTLDDVIVEIESSNDDGTSKTRKTMRCVFIDNEWCVADDTMDHLLFRGFFTNKKQSENYRAAIDGLPAVEKTSKNVLVSVTKLWHAMHHFVNQNKKSKAFELFQSFSRTINPDSIAVFIGENIEKAAQNAIIHTIRWASWHRPHIRDPPSNASQQRALEDIQKILDAIKTVKKARPFIHLDLDRELLGSFIKTIHDFYALFPEFH
jgi:hypothetical protein